MKTATCVLALASACILAHATPGNAQTVSANTNHSLAVKPDGTAWAWGANGSGQLGDGTNWWRLQPVQVSSLTGVIAVAAGDSFSLALKSDGTVWAWGANWSNQLGDGSTTNRTTPVQVSSLTDIVAIAAGTRHSLALKSDGTVYGWGGNGSGQIGDGTNTQRSTPVQLTGISGVSAIATRASHSLALKTDGTVKAWGNGGDGQLGTGSTSSSNAPVSVSSLTSVAEISAGEAHSLARLSNGTVYAWGWNGSGELGDGTTTRRTSPVAVSSLGAADHIAAGGQHSLAVMGDGSVYAWGSNAAWQLGTGTGSTNVTPVSVSSLSGMAFVAAGSLHTLFLSDDDALYAAGRNWDAQIGDGTWVPRFAPVALSVDDFEWKVGTPTFSLGGGTYSSEQNVTLWCNTPGATIHYTLNGATPTESDPTPPGNGVVTITQSATLKFKAWKTGMPESNVDFAVYVLALPTPTFSPGAGTYTSPPTVTVSIAASGATIHYTTNGNDPLESDPTVASGGTVAVTQGLVLKAKAWRTGWTTSAMQTAGYTLKVATPQLSPGGGSYTSAQSVTVSTTTPSATLRYTTNGAQPTASDATVASGSTVPVGGTTTLRVKGFRSGWVDSDPVIAIYTFNLGTVATPSFSPAGGTYTAGQSVTITSATTDAVIRYTLDGSDPTLTSKRYAGSLAVAGPAQIKARAFKRDWTPSATATAAYAFDYGTVAIPTLVPPGGDYASARSVTVATTTSGATIHYTTNGLDPTTSDPTVTSGGTVLVDKAMRLKARAFKTGETESAVVTGDYWITGTVSAGETFTLALKADGTVWSWGSNSQGELGDGTTTQRGAPVQVSALTSVAAIAAGSLYGLALKQDGTVWSWGNNQFGQLGDGTTANKSTAAQVSGLTDVAAIAAGDTFSMALKKDGTLCAWGGNSSGQVGDGTTTQRLTPTCLTTIGGVSAIAAAGSHALALKTDGGATGSVWSWGTNADGQVGDGTTTNRPTPTGVIASAVGIAAGARHSLAVMPDTTARAWGYNIDFRLGDATQVARPAPVVVKDLDGVVELAGGGQHSLARTSARAVWFWGDNNANNTYAEPYRFPTGGTSVVAIAAGKSHSVTARRDGSVWIWGLNLNSQLGDNTFTPRYWPMVLSGFSLVDAAWVTADQDGDGLETWRELEIGSDPRKADTNDDGLLDGAADRSGQSATNPDMDGDGVTNALERQRGTDPFRADTDGDTVNDNADAFPLDPTRSSAPSPTPGDTTPPVIILILPMGAILIGG